MHFNQTRGFRGDPQRPLSTQVLQEAHPVFRFTPLPPTSVDRSVLTRAALSDLSWPPCSLDARIESSKGNPNRCWTASTTCADFSVNTGLAPAPDEGLQMRQESNATSSELIPSSLDFRSLPECSLNACHTPWRWDLSDSSTSGAGATLDTPWSSGSSCPSSISSSPPSSVPSTSYSGVTKISGPPTFAVTSEPVEYDLTASSDCSWTLADFPNTQARSRELSTAVGCQTFG